MSEIKVLDHGYVKLIDSMGSDEAIIEAARMSTGGSFVSWDPYEGHPKGDAGLLSYLYRNQHMTPFEMGDLIVEVQAPIFVVREWMRHRTFSFNEASARYAQMPDLHYLPPNERLVRQDSVNKQAGSQELIHPDAQDLATLFLKSEQEAVYGHYETMLRAGLAREVARINAPVSRYTRFRVKANLRNWLQFLALRLPENAQYEIRVFAEAVAQLVKAKWPRTYALFEEHTLHGKHLSRTECQEYLRWKEQHALLPDGWRWCQAEKVSNEQGAFLDRNPNGTWDSYLNGVPGKAGLSLKDGIESVECYLREDQ